MKQTILGQSKSATATGGATRYQSLMGSIGTGTESWDTTRGNTIQVIPFDCTISNLTVKVLSGTVTANNTFSIMKAANAVLTTTLTAGDTIAVSTGNVDFTAGDSVSLQGITNDALVVEWSCEARTVASRFFMLGNSGAASYHVSDQEYIRIGSSDASEVVANKKRSRFLIPHDCTLTDFYVELEGAVETGSVDFTIHKNGSDEATTTLTFADGAGSDLSVSDLDISLDRGDNIMIHITPTDTPTTRDYYFGLGFKSLYSSGFHNFILGSSLAVNSQTTSTPRYHKFYSTTTAGFPTGSSSFRNIAADQITLKSFYVGTSDVTPGSGNSYDVTVQENGEDTVMTVNISDSETSKSDLINEVVIDKTNEVGVKFIANSTPTTVFFQFSASGSSPGYTTGTHLKERERSFFQTLTGGSAQTNLHDLKRQYFVSQLSPSDDDARLQDLEKSWLRKVISDEGATPIGDQMSDLYMQAVAAIGVPTGRNINENKRLLYIHY